MRELVDTGCSTTVVAKSCVPPSKLIRGRQSVQKIDGSESSKKFRASIPIECDGRRIECNVLVEPEVIASRAEVLLRMDAIG